MSEDSRNLLVAMCLTTVVLIALFATCTVMHNKCVEHGGSYDKDGGCHMNGEPADE